MTATATFPAANYDTAGFALTDTSETTVFQAVSGFTAFFPVELWMADDGGAARTVTVQVYIAGTAYTLVYQGAIAANVPLVYNFTGLTLLKTASNTDKITVTGSAAGIHGYVSYLKGTRAA